MQSAAAASSVAREGRFLIPQATYISIATATTTATAMVTAAATQTVIVGCTVSGSDIPVCQDLMGVDDPWFEFTVASTTGAPASTTAMSGRKRRRRSADGEVILEWDYEGEEDEEDEENEDED